MLASGACGPGASTDDVPPRFAVVERGLPWELEQSADVPPISILWDFETPAADHGDATWRSGVGSREQLEGGVLTVGGSGTISMQGGALDPDVHHVISLRAKTSHAKQIIVRWRSEKQNFHESRSYRQPIDPALGDEFQNLTIPVTSLRGSRHELPKLPDDPPDRIRWSKARDAAEGDVAELRIEFVGTGKGVLRVDVDEVLMLSEYDAAPPGSLRLGREGIYMRGSVLRPGGRLEADLTPGPHDRLRLALAVAGAERAQVVTLSDRDGKLPPMRWTLAPGQDWLDEKIDLSPLGGEAARLVLSAEENSAGPSRAAVMVGNVMRLAPTNRPRPNIVLYLEDTLRADRLATYGYVRQTDPHLQQIAARGVVFERAFAMSNWTRPATSSVLTSLDTLTHGNNDHTKRVAESFFTVAEALAAEGYLTTSYVTNFNASEWAGLEQGMDIWREPPAYGAVHVSDSLTSAAIGPPIRQFIEDHRDEQLFLYAHSGDPHIPYDPPDNFLDELGQGPMGNHHETMDAVLQGSSLRYDAEVRHNDHELKLLDETLDQLGLMDDTLFVFVSDHGEAFMEHGTLAHRNTLHQEELHVPLVMRWPAGLPNAQRRPENVSQLDIAPTMLGLVDGATDPGWQGRDLSAALREGTAIEDEPILAHVLHGAPKLGEKDEVAVIWGRYKLVAGLSENGQLSPRALYDLHADPGETVDLLHDPSVAQALAGALSWAEHRIEASRAASRPAGADEMDPAKRQWMFEMGYLR